MFKMRGVTLSKCTLLWVFPVIFLAAGLLALPTMANADGGNGSLIHACVNPSGMTRIVGPTEMCLPRETPVHWSASGGGLTVVDSLNKTVGPLADRATVIVTVGGDRFFVSVGPSGFVGNPTFYFQAANCAGPPLITPTRNEFLPLLKVVGTTGYYGGRDYQNITPASKRTYDNNGGTPTCVANTQSTDATPAVRTVDLSGFTPPFSVK